MNQLSVTGLHLQVGKEKIVRDFSHSFAPGKITGVLAAVDEKITYLLKVLCGILEPSSGSVTIDGVDLFTAPAKDIAPVRRILALCADRGGLISNLTVRENLLLPLDFHFPDVPYTEKHSTIKELLATLDIHEEVLEERPAVLHPQIYKMVLLTRAFVLQPGILLLDNPFLDLERHYQRIIYRYIVQLRDEQQVTQVFLSTSDLLFDIADDIIVFNRGNYVESGNWQDLLLHGKPATHHIIRQYMDVGINQI